MPEEPRTRSRILRYCQWVGLPRTIGKRQPQFTSPNCPALALLNSIFSCASECRMNFLIFAMNTTLLPKPCFTASSLILRKYAAGLMACIPTGRTNECSRNNISTAVLSLGPRRLRDHRTTRADLSTHPKGLYLAPGAFPQRRDFCHRTLYCQKGTLCDATPPR